MEMTETLEQSRPGLTNQVQAAIRDRELNQRAEQTYLHWISRFVLFHNLKDPDTLGESDQSAFLDYLKNHMLLSRARLNQASQALAFFYQDVLGKSLANPAAA